MREIVDLNEAIFQATEFFQNMQKIVWNSISSLERMVQNITKISQSRL